MKKLCPQSSSLCLQRVHLRCCRVCICAVLPVHRGRHHASSATAVTYYDQPPFRAVTCDTWVLGLEQFGLLLGAWTGLSAAPGLLWTPDIGLCKRSMYSTKAIGSARRFLCGILTALVMAVRLSRRPLDNGAFFYNSSVNNVGSTNITNVYNEKSSSTT